MVSDKSEKTVIVRVDRRVRHPVYKKTIQQSKKYAAHDEKSQFKIGDKVSIIESAPDLEDEKMGVVVYDA